MDFIFGADTACSPQITYRKACPLTSYSEKLDIFLPSDINSSINEIIVDKHEEGDIYQALIFFVIANISFEIGT